MSDFMFLFRGEMKAATPAEMQAEMQKWVAWMNDVRAKGNYKAGAPLDRKVGHTVTGKKKAVTDGPFAEAKDLVGGYWIVSARDLAHATEIAKGCPLLESDGVVEIRAVLDLPPT